MSRREEVEAAIDDAYKQPECFHEAKIRGLIFTLADEVDELRGKLDDVRMNIGCARGQRSTQFCAEAAQRDAVIGKLLAMLEQETGDEPSVSYPEDPRLARWQTVTDLYTRACAILNPETTK